MLGQQLTPGGAHAVCSMHVEQHCVLTHVLAGYPEGPHANTTGFLPLTSRPGNLADLCRAMQAVNTHATGC